MLFASVQTQGVQKHNIQYIGTRTNVTTLTYTHNWQLTCTDFKTGFSRNICNAISSQSHYQFLSIWCIDTANVHFRIIWLCENGARFLPFGWTTLRCIHFTYVVFGKHTKQHNQMTYTIQICRLFLLFSLVLFPFKSYISGKPENCKLDYL